MNAITKLTLVLGAAALLAFPASSQAHDPPHRHGWGYHQHDHRHGVRITSVAFRSPAARAGLERGDIILEVDGRDISHSEQLHRALHATGFRGVLTVRDTRTGHIRRVQVFPHHGHIGVTLASVR